MTPGAVALTDTNKVCSAKWGVDERAVSPAMKKQVYALYGTVPGQGVCKLTSHKAKNGTTVTKGCEVDHRVSREVGGADDIKNLWPQPYLTPDPVRMPKINWRTGFISRFASRRPCHWNRRNRH